MSAQTADHVITTINSTETRLKSSASWGKAWQVCLALGVVGVVLSFIGYESKRFAFAWLFAIVTVLAIALGSLFFIFVGHLVGAAWNVVFRRVAEFNLVLFPVLFVLFTPLYFHLDELYPWMELHHKPAAHAAEARQGEQAGHGEHAGHAEQAHSVDKHDAGHSPQHALHEETLKKKIAYLNPTGWRLRTVFCFVVWTLLGLFYLRNSLRQDDDGSLEHSKKSQKWAPVTTMLFACTLTMAIIDWVMSLEPNWFSTIFGVQYFSVSVVSGFASIVLLSLAYRSEGALSFLNKEHYHDLGKMLFGFLVFWAYISFSQLMLIAYASIPEETTYYHLRWSGPWTQVSLLLIFGHFVVPFLLLISRNAKRAIWPLKFGAAWILVMHVIEIHWLVMPYFEAGNLNMHWANLAALMAVGGIAFGVVFYVTKLFPLVPVRDPRLARSLAMDNG